ncbi:MAG: sigma 54-interacting transcriptional regulator [Bacteriovoracaceae bacterium]|nr:sigma 54-interacting transcriptional regulator [Bacteriovoracaceae bacterium]
MILKSFSEFKFYQSFRIPVEKADELRFLIERSDESGKYSYIEDANLVDISVTGLGFSSYERVSVGTEMNISLQFKKLHLDLTGRVVRAFSPSISDAEIIYGVELDEDQKIAKFLEHYVLSFTAERARNCLTDSALREKYTKSSDGFEMFSLLLTLFNDMTYFGDRDGFIDNMVEEVARVLNAQRASVFLINPETNQLEALSAMGVKKDELKFDYRSGIAGTVFTTGVALNIDTRTDRSRFNGRFDKHFGFKTKSIICYPINNFEDKIIGVIEVLNKRNQDRFTVEDEKTMKVLALVFSSVFHTYNPISDSSQIRKFSTPFDRPYVFIGKDSHTSELRKAILKVKDLDDPVLIAGEHGVGKSLYARILHYEGKRGLHPYDILECGAWSEEKIDSFLFDSSSDKCKLKNCQFGTLVLKEVSKLSYATQLELLKCLAQKELPNGGGPVNVKILATTSEDLGALVEDGVFNKELYELLSQAYIKVEPLRKRINDIEALVEHFLRLECRNQGFLLKAIAPEAMEVLKQYDWPGNMQELKICMGRLVLYNPKKHTISKKELESVVTPMFDIDAKRRMFGEVDFVSDFKIPLKDRVALVEREMIFAEIKRHHGNKSQTAKAMGISREALRKKLQLSSSILENLNKESNVVSIQKQSVEKEDKKKAA